MSFREWRHRTISQMRGPRTRPDAVDVPKGRALDALNVEYDAESVRSRHGFATLHSLSEKAAALHNWIKNVEGATPTGNALLYVAPDTTKSRMIPNLASPSPIDLFTQADMASAVHAESGVQVMVAPLKANGTSAGQCRVVRAYGAAVNVDKAFHGPSTFSFTATDHASAGNVTAGSHRVAYRVLTRNGYLAPLSPTPSGVFTPVSVTATGDQRIQFGFTSISWPIEAAQVFMFMTTTTNLNRYYRVPDANFAVPGGGSPYTYSAYIDISDLELETVGAAVESDELNLFAQNYLGVGPFNPHSVAELGNRMAYIATVEGIDQMYASEPNQHQVITADQHVVSLPGFRRIVAAAMIRSAIYILGPNWTYVTTDNGRKPVEWPAIQIVDGQIGTPAPRGVSVNTAQGYMWVAHPNGMYLFSGGKYPDRPVSWFVQDWWARINWSNPTDIEVVDQPHLQRVLVRAPLDGTPLRDYLFVFDYTVGVSPEEINFTPWKLAAGALSGVAVYEHPTTKRLELMTATSAGLLLRQKQPTDTTPYADQAGAFTTTYQPAYQPERGADVGQVLRFHAFDARVRGSGTLLVTAYGADPAKTFSTSLTLTATPGKDQSKRLALQSEAASLKFSTESGWFNLSWLKVYFTPWIWHR